MDKKTEARQGYNSGGKGSLCIIGIGPGGIGHLTFRAKEVMERCDVVVGYKTYIDLIKGLIQGKEVFSTGMTKEVDRCRKAIELAMQGKRVAVVSSGDAGVYGMAGLALELIGCGKWEVGGGKDKKHIPHPTFHIPVSIIPGVPAFCAAAALLGAPLMHDFASISLSDLLTSWETIKKRLEMACQGDFVIILYNPKSMKRTNQLKEAIEIVSTYRDNKTPVGMVKSATREDEVVKITTLKDVADFYDFIDMSTIVIIGNSATFIANGRIITPRGYSLGEWGVGGGRW